MKKITVALVGQPNVGKSTLFNTLTKGHVIVTNWPGTTVERHEGRVRYRNTEITFVDLPGIYGLSYSTLEEKISRDNILSGKQDLIVVLVDSLALERTMYLAIELLEVTSRLLVVVTKIDEAHSRGIHINYEILEKALGVPVVPVSAAKNIGLRELLDHVVMRSKDITTRPLVIDYGELNIFIDAIVSVLKEANIELRYPLRWFAVKFLEEDIDVENEVKNCYGGLYERLKEIRDEAIKRFGKNIAIIISTKRFEYINSLIKSAIVKIDISSKRVYRVFNVFYNPYIAPVISLLILLLIFLLAFTVNTGYPITQVLEFAGFSHIASWIREHSLSSSLEKLLDLVSNGIYGLLGHGVLSRFIVEAVFGGVFTLFLFIPLLIVVFTLLGILEDTGIGPRMAVGLHPLMQKIGLSGHAIFPMTISLGCNVPGIMVTRATPNSLERIRLMLILPFIPCQARLVVLLAIASALGGLTGTVIVPLAYLVSFTIVILVNYVLYTIAKKRSGDVIVELLLEIPPVHKPILKVIWWYTWFYLKHFLVKAGTIIITASILIWFISNINSNLQLVDSVNESVAASLSSTLAPLFKPIGIVGENSWILVFALITGFIAKELFLSTLIVTSGLNSLREVFQLIELKSASIIAITIFVVLYMPCLATLATIYSESKDLKLTLMALVLSLLVAYVTSLIVYHIFSFLIQVSVIP